MPPTRPPGGDTAYDLRLRVLRTTKLITEEAWDDNQEEIIRECNSWHIKEPFPSCKVGEFMVSKQYFVGAARAFIGSREWSDEWDEDEWDEEETTTLHEQFLASDTIKALQAFLRTLQTGNITPEALSHLPCLLNLRFTIQQQDFVELTDYNALDDYIPMEDMRELRVFKKCESLFDRGLKDLTVYSTKDLSRRPQPGHGRRWATKEETDMFKQNVGRLESLIRQCMLSSSKTVTTTEAGEAGTACIALYPGSAVCINCSKIHNPIPNEERAIRTMVRQEPERIVEYVRQCRVAELETEDREAGPKVSRPCSQNLRRYR